MVAPCRNLQAPRQSARADRAENQLPGAIPEVAAMSCRRSAAPRALLTFCFLSAGCAAKLPPPPPAPQKAVAKAPVVADATRCGSVIDYPREALLARAQGEVLVAVSL